MIVVVSDPLVTPLPCVQIKFGRYKSNGISVVRGSQNFSGRLGLRPLGMGRWLTPRITPPHACYHVEFGRFRPNGSAHIGRSA